MAFVLMHAACARCHAPFAFNPLRVPSVLIKGRREPLCRPCVEWANAERARRGMPTWPIYPDSYEPVDEQEVPWPEP
jgi:hypothetical protein